MAITLTEKAAKKIQAQLAKNGSGIGLLLEPHLAVVMIKTASSPHISRYPKISPDWR